MTDSKVDQDRARSIAADAFRYVEPSSEQRSPFRQLKVTEDQKRAVDKARKDLEERVTRRFPSKAPG